MSAPARIGHDPAPLPPRGTRVVLDGLPGGPWTSAVEAVRDDVVLLDAPRLGGRPVRLPLRRPFVIAYAHRLVPCEVDAELVAEPSGGRGAYAARVSGEPRRIQRRRAVRVPVRLIARASLGDDHDGRPVGAVTENLSAAGALLRLPHAIGVDSVMRVSVECGGEAGTMHIAGRVVRCDLVPGGDRPWRVAIAFLDLPQPEEDRLVRFVFGCERLLRRHDGEAG
ncbi:PilZ domain-containing protein [Miltoncostaea marina]|uniref:PilZ domain-containing protein n=1 Tax=Miltoncostaea marina TaxID=2843215 RepID=UPI001C3E67F7|nr:PilZ domain-containing protein [Miltoncostaea marina]